MSAYADKHRFDRVGGRLSLDFLNTMSGLRGENPNKRIAGVEDLASWGHQAGLIERRRMQELIAEAGQHPRRSAQALADALAAREALHDVVMAAIDRTTPPAAALETVNRWIAAAMQHRRLRPKAGGGFEAAFDDDGDLAGFLRPVAVDAARLLEEQLEAGLVRRCEESRAGRCGWIFVDETRNHSRRYCSMSDCGNRAKQRRYWQRQKE